MNYLVGVLVVALGVILGFFAKDVNSILQWIVSGLYGGYIASNVLKWYWWRFRISSLFKQNNHFLLYAGEDFFSMKNFGFDKCNHIGWAVK